MIFYFTLLLENKKRGKNSRFLWQDTWNGLKFWKIGGVCIQLQCFDNNSKFENYLIERVETLAHEFFMFRTALGECFDENSEFENYLIERVETLAHEFFMFRIAFGIRKG